MKNSFWTLFFGLFLGVCAIYAQTSGQTPNPAESAARIREGKGETPGNTTLQGLLNPDPRKRLPISPSKTRILLTKRDRALTAVDAQDRSKYAAFLKSPDTGILRLHDSEDCDEEGKTIGASEPCPWNITGKATIYSFRTGDYTNKIISDIEFEEKTFRVVGLNLLGFLTDLGDVSIENLNLQSSGIREMAEFTPSLQINEITYHFNLAKNGFQVGDYIYKNEVRMNPNKTYALRSIAYDSKVFLKIGKRKIDLLENDKRKDIIVIFRVIREHEDGSVNILWKKIQSKDAPKLQSN